MSKYAGNALVVMIGGDAVTANLIKSVEISQTADTYESTGAGDTHKSYLGGHQDSSVRIDAWDDSTVGAMRTKFAVGTAFTGSTTAALHIRPQGTGSKPNLAIAGIVTGLTVGVSHDGVAPVSITIQPTAAIVETNAD
jgi:hypothetical protein